MSVNRLQFFQTDDRAIAIEGIKWEFRAINYNLRPNGRFVVFNVGRAFQAVKEKGYDITFMYTPKKPHQPSHSSIYCLPREGDRKGRLVTATALKRLISKADIYDAVP